MEKLMNWARKVHRDGKMQGLISHKQDLVCESILLKRLGAGISKMISDFENAILTAMQKMN